MVKYIFALLFLLGLIACAEETEVKENQFFVEEETVEVDLLSQLTDSLKIYPKNIELWLQKGNLCKDDYNFACALDAGANAFMIDSTNLEARKLYGWTLINKPNTPVSDIERAKRHFQYVLSIDSDDVESLVNLANTYSLTGDFKTAINYINKGLRIDEYYRDGYVLKGSIYKTLENYKLALSSYQTAVQIDPQFFMGHLQLGWLLTEMEDHELALEYYRNAAEINPENINSLYGVAKSLQDLERYDEALVEYRKIVEVEPSFYYTYYNQGFIKQYYQNDLDSAEYFYDKVLFYNDQYVPAWYQLGNVYYDLKNYAESYQCYANALDIDEDYALAREAAERLRNVTVN
ncbi:MAG: tetratricopeptide repeat protein [Brumimicrobium sp.]